MRMDGWNYVHKKFENIKPKWCFTRNKLSLVADFVKDRDIQLVASILKDKLPDGLVNKANVIVELSQTSKLFKIEESL